MRANKCQHIALNIEYTSEALFIKRFHNMIMLFLYSPTDNCSDTCSTWSQWHGEKWDNGTMVAARNRTCTQPNCMTDDTKLQNCSNSECSGL